MSISKPLNLSCFAKWNGGKFIEWGDFLPFFILQLVYWIGILHAVELPGLYMDAVNPEYLAARTLNPEIKNPVFALPTAFFLFSEIYITGFRIIMLASPFFF